STRYLSSISSSSLFFLLLRPHPRPTLFPYTTLFRSAAAHTLPVERSQVAARQTARMAAAAVPDAHSCAECRNMVTAAADQRSRRSEEHTSELQSHLNLVCRLLLEKKK